jgi:large subunit ribosomal protein L28
MPKECELTGTRSRAGRNVAHSNRVTLRRFDPNLQNVSFLSDALGRTIPLRVTTRTIRTVQKKGGLDAFLLASDEASLPLKARRLKRRVHKALSGR